MPSRADGVESARPNPGEKTPAVLVSALGMIVGDAGGGRVNGAVEVLGVLPAGPAFRGGVERGDVIHEVNGLPVAACSDLRRFFSSHDPAQPVRILFRRGEMLRFLALSLDRP